ncbi:MAG TPA: AbrB/MazE/SpoVT family DNA-binding domain-containing protein [Candidatus Binataceae bacterium]|nr:AbrB/MazE/SpoVT family DNA-binding domain-containing protein [Candidatus Binataceae bacterium]
MKSVASKVGRRGTIVIPAKLHKKFALEEGSFILAEERDGGVLIRPAEIVAVETYTPARRARSFC